MMAFDPLLDALSGRSSNPVELPEPLALTDLPTPALVLDRGAFERNLRRMADFLGASGKGFRPHAKTHKCPTISVQQMAAGAVGVCAAKPSEAFALAAAGIEDILITSPLSSPPKVAILERIAALGTQLKIVVDSERGLDLLEEIDSPLGVLIDLDIEMGRTGVRDDALVLRLIDRVETASHLTFLGFQHYAGHLMHVHGRAERAERSIALWARIVERVESLGVPFSILTGCGTGTYDIDVAVEAITDLQVGSYVFMDEEYRQIGGREGDRFEDFEVALTVATTAISQPMDGAVTVDAGYKAMASDTVPAAVDELVNTKFRFAGDEHGVLISRESLQSVRLGDVVRLVTPHCDPTVNLHEVYWIMEEDGAIRSCWPITARGCNW